MVEEEEEGPPAGTTEPATDWDDWDEEEVAVPSQASDIDVFLAALAEVRGRPSSADSEELASVR